MNKILLIALLLITCQLFAQKNFEGRITYNEYASGDSVKKKMIVYLKENKIFVEHPDNSFEQPNVLYDFAEGRAYTFVTDSIAMFSKLGKNIFPPDSTAIDSTEAFAKIAGYACYKVSGVINPPFDSYFTKVQNWFTKDLFFKVSDSANFITPPLFFFNENSISLKTKIYFNKTNKKAPADITIEAIEVKEEDIPAAKFEIAKYRRIVSFEAYSAEVIEKFKAADKELKKKKQQ